MQTLARERQELKRDREEVAKAIEEHHKMEEERITRSVSHGLLGRDNVVFNPTQLPLTQTPECRHKQNNSHIRVFFSHLSFVNLCYVLRGFPYLIRQKN